MTEQKEKAPEGQQKKNIVFITTDKLVDGRQVIVTVMIIVSITASFLYGYFAYHYQQKLKEVTEMHELYIDSLRIHRDGIKRFNEEIDRMNDEINKMLGKIKAI